MAKTISFLSWSVFMDGEQVDPYRSGEGLDGRNYLRITKLISTPSMVRRNTLLRGVGFRIMWAVHKLRDAPGDLGVIIAVALIENPESRNKNLESRDHRHLDLILDSALIIDTFQSDYDMR